jgi:hypothetical protein
MRTFSRFPTRFAVPKPEKRQMCHFALVLVRIEHAE